MNKSFRLIAALIILALLGSLPVPARARPMVAIISLLSPSSCPPGGCAAGQRLNIRAAFDVNPQITTLPNTQVCVYTSMEGLSKWADDGVFSITDPATFTTGNPSGICGSNIPSGTQLLNGAYAQFSTAGTRNFDFGFRINKNSTTAGSLQISVYQLNGAGDTWVLTDPPTVFTITVTSASGSAYVASSVGNCGIYFPCYLNSGDDLAGGFGTGLKDAVDASPVNATITILGTYIIKSNAVILNNPQTLRGINDAALTYSGTACNNGMLSVTNGATIRDLNINDGSCSAPSRDLIAVNSLVDASLISNDLVNGKDAVSIQDNSGNVSIRFNHIAGNSGYGVLRAPGTGTGTINTVANNIQDNRSGYQIECNNKGDADHNYWGSSNTPSSSISNCTYSSGKQLGAAIVLNSYKPGVAAETVNLTGAKTSYIDGTISLDGTNGSQLIVANHGNGSASNVPFIGNGTEAITACSNFWDVFISDENTVSPSSLNLYLKYDLTTACLSKIESPALCGGADIASYPLLWFDPKNSITDGWDTTGQSPAGIGASGLSGQTTTCDMVNNEIVVSIDNGTNQRPNLSSDLSFSPFVIGYPFIFSSFNAIPGIAKVDLDWETSSENNINGFYVVRALLENGPYYRTSSLITAKGDASIGGIYSYTDSGLANGTTYWYKIEMIDSNNLSLGFNNPIAATTYSMIPTATVVTPDNVEVYGLSLALTVKGNNFIPSSQVVWDNNLAIDLTTSFIDSTQLTAIIPGSLFDDPDSSDTHEITVYNPGSGGGFSPPLTFTIKNPIPTLTSISPEYSDGNSTTITLSVKGDYFVDDSVVRFNGSSSNVTTTFVDRYNLTASILRSKLSAGIITVTVYNPTYGGGTSITGKSFNIYTPTPTLTKQATSTRTRTVVSVYRSPTPQRTRTRTPTRTSVGTLLTPTPSFTPGLLTPSATLATLDLTVVTQLPSVSVTPTPSLAPGEPTYTPVPPTPEPEAAGASVWTWRMMSSLRLLAGILLGASLLSFPAFLVFRRKTRNKTPR
jgi:hypothetical protein